MVKGRQRKRPGNPNGWIIQGRAAWAGGGGEAQSNTWAKFRLGGGAWQPGGQCDGVGLKDVGRTWWQRLESKSWI